MILSYSPISIHALINSLSVNDDIIAKPVNTIAKNALETVINKSSTSFPVVVKSIFQFV